MALARAVVVGAVAAIAIPYLNSEDGGQLSEWLGRGVVHFTAGTFHLAWSWPIFCIVTLLAWALLVAAKNR